MKFKFYAIDNYFYLSAQIAQNSMATHNWVQHEKELSWNVCTKCYLMVGLEECSEIRKTIEDNENEPPYFIRPLSLSCDEFKTECMVQDIIE